MMSSFQQQQKDLTDDIETLLEYAQALRDENESLKSVLRGSFIFIGNDDKEKILRAVAGAKIVFPQLKTISGGWKQSLNGKEYKDAVSGTTAVDKSRPPDFEELEEPVLHTISDLAALLLEYNKLTGRLLQFTPYNIITNSTTIPNIGDHNLNNVRVVDIRENQGTHEFVLHVTWSNGQHFEIHRRYWEFFTFQATLRGLKSWKQRRQLSAEPFPKLPLSNHLLVVLGRLNTAAELKQQSQLVEAFCKAAVAEVAGKTGGDIYRTTVLIFFTCKSGDFEIQIQSTGQESDFDFPPEDHSEEADECLGFLSSVALTKDAQLQHVNSEDAPKESKAAEEKHDILCLKFNQPSSAQPHVTHRHSAPGVMTDPRDIPKPQAMMLAQVVSKLAILKSYPHPCAVLAEGKKAGDPQSRKEFRRRSHDSSKSEDISLARRKAISIEAGSTDWGVRNSEPDKNNSADNGTGQLNAV